MKARVLPDAIVITLAQIVEGETVLETSCANFEQYCALPQAVEFEGRVCGKTGWSSDRNYACYKSGAMVAHAVKHQ